MGRSIHQPSAGEFAKLASLELWILESGGFTPHGVGRQIEGLNAEDVTLLNTLDRPFHSTVFAPLYVREKSDRLLLANTPKNRPLISPT